MEDCIFCRIIKGEIPSERVYEDEKIIVINDIAPAANAHVLIIPKKHTENITTADGERIAYMFGKIAKISQLLGIKENGFRIVVNAGSDGGQTVNHLHLHLRGGNELGWPPC